MKILPVILLAALPLSQTAFANLSSVPSVDEEKYLFVKDVDLITTASVKHVDADSRYYLFKDVDPTISANEQTAEIMDSISVLKDEFIDNLNVH